MNALLSFLYVLLAHDCRSALEGVGLDPQIGFLHEVRPGRSSLALDLMEEFRAVLVDRLALTLVNLKKVTERDFKLSESGAVAMSDDVRKTVVAAWQQKKQEEVTHPFLGEKMSAGLLLHYQALLLARHLRGDLDAYPPYGTHTTLAAGRWMLNAQARTGIAGLAVFRRANRTVEKR